MNFIWYWILQKNLNNASLQNTVNWSKYSIFLRTAVIIIFRDTAEGSSLFPVSPRDFSVLYMFPVSPCNFFVSVSGFSTWLLCLCVRFLHVAGICFPVSLHDYSAFVSAFSTWLLGIYFRYLHVNFLYLFPIFPGGFSASVSGFSTLLLCICNRFFLVASRYLSGFSIWLLYICFRFPPRGFSVNDIRAAKLLHRWGILL